MWPSLHFIFAAVVALIMIIISMNIQHIQMRLVAAADVIVVDFLQFACFGGAVMRILLYDHNIVVRLKMILMLCDIKH